MQGVELMSDEELIEASSAFGLDLTDMERESIVSMLKTFPNRPIPDEYMDVLQPGAVIAFRDDVLKVRSSKVVRRSSSEKKLLVETAYGKRFLIGFNDVVWIKTTTRWPRWVFDLLKGSGNGSKAES